jgi:hypothetical protein
MRKRRESRLVLPAAVEMSIPSVLGPDYRVLCIAGYEFHQDEHSSLVYSACRTCHGGRVPCTACRATRVRFTGTLDEARTDAYVRARNAASAGVRRHARKDTRAVTLAGWRAARPNLLHDLARVQGVQRAGWADGVLVLLAVRATSRMLDAGEEALAVRRLAVRAWDEAHALELTTR